MASSVYATVYSISVRLAVFCFKKRFIKSLLIVIFAFTVGEDKN